MTSTSLRGEGTLELGTVLNIEKLYQKNVFFPPLLSLVFHRLTALHVLFSSYCISYHYQIHKICVMQIKLASAYRAILGEWVLDRRWAKVHVIGAWSRKGKDDLG